MYQDNGRLLRTKPAGDRRAFRHVPLSFRDKSGPELMSITNTSTNRTPGTVIRPPLSILAPRTYGVKETFSWGDISDTFTDGYNAVNDAAQDVGSFGENFGITVSGGIDTSMNALESGFNDVSAGTVSAFDSTVSGFDSILDGSILNAVLAPVVGGGSGVKIQPLSDQEKATIKALSAQQKMELANLLRGKSVIDQITLLRKYLSDLKTNPNVGPIPSMQLTKSNSGLSNNTLIFGAAVLVALYIVMK